MKLASFLYGERPSFGIVKDDGIVDLSRRLGGDLKAALGRDIGLDEVRKHGSEPTDITLDGVRFLPAVPNPAKILCIGLNYRDHAEETGADIPKRPTIFVRFADAEVGHLQPIVRPKASTKYDYEGELAVIIGRAARHVPREAALDFVAGYSCFNDGTIRDWQGHSSQFTAGKNFLSTGAVGPWLVTADEIGDPAGLALETRLNGEVMQSGSTADLIFDVPTLIEYITTFTQLMPGDIIATGTPAGVGYRRRPPRYLQSGDVVEVEIETIGTLRNPVVDEA